MNTGTTSLYDLIEFRWDISLKSFVKVQTHKTNIPKAIAYSEKKKIEFLIRPNSLRRFKVVKNGELQYSNKFK